MRAEMHEGLHWECNGVYGVVYGVIYDNIGPTEVDRWLPTPKCVVFIIKIDDLKIYGPLELR